MKYLFYTLCIVGCLFTFRTKTSGQNTNTMLSAKQDRADSFYAQNKWQEAALMYVELVHALAGNTEIKGKNAFNAAKSYHYAGNTDSAVIWYKNALDLFGSLKMWDNYYTAQTQLADVLDDKGEYETALHLSEKAAAYFKRQNDSISAANTLNNLALIHYHMGHVKESIHLYSEAIVWAGNNKDALKAKCYNQLGNIWADDLKDESKALEYYRKSLQLKLNDAPAQSVSAAYNNIGISHKNLGNTDSALVYFNLALDYAVQSKLPKAKINPLINIANLYKKQQQTDMAVKTYNQVLELADHMNKNQLINIHTNLGTAYNQWDNFDKALQHLHIARDYAEGTDFLLNRADIQLQLALAYSGLKKYDKAYAAQIQYTQLKDSIYTRAGDQEIADVMLKYEAAQKDKSILEQQQIIQQKELEIQKRTLWLVSAIALILAVSGILFYLFKRKEAAARQANLELKLAEQKELTRIQEERLRISRELHDNIGSYLTLISASVEQMSSDPATAMGAALLPRLKDSLSMSMRELRKTVWLLNKQAVSVDEIALRLRDFFKPLQQNGAIIKVVTEGNADRQLTEIQTTHLFRIIQEAVNNAYKYADGSQIDIRLKVTEPEGLCFEIEDNGRGFDMDVIQAGNGIQNMKSRISELKGELSITAGNGKGTLVTGCFGIHNT